jgi:hypothetical protein
MALWFGPFVPIRPDSSYFYLCPTCYRNHVQPHVDAAQGRLGALYRRARELGLHADPSPESDPEPPTGGPSVGRPETVDPPMAIHAARGEGIP